jgi:hypothetical protein
VRVTFLLKSRSCECLVKVLSNFIDELKGVKVLVSSDLHGSLDENGKILGHETSFDGIDDNLLEGIGEVQKLFVVVEVGSGDESLGPGEHGGNGVGRGLLSLLMESVVSSDGTVSSLSFNRAIGALKNRGHESEGSVTLSNDVGLDVTIVVLASPNEATLRLDRVGNHIVNESVLVPETKLIELSLVFFVENFLEDILESSIVLLHNCVLRRHVAWIFELDGVLETRVGESGN